MNYWWASRKIWTLASRYQRQRSSCFLVVPSFCGHARASASKHASTSSCTASFSFFNPLGVRLDTRTERTREDRFSVAAAHGCERTNGMRQTTPHILYYVIFSASRGSCSRYSLAWLHFTFAHFHYRSPDLHLSLLTEALIANVAVSTPPPPPPRLLTPVFASTVLFLHLFWITYHRLWLVLRDAWGF